METLVVKQNKNLVSNLDNIEGLIDFHNQGYHSEAKEILTLLNNEDFYFAIDKDGIVYAYSESINEFVYLAFDIPFSEKLDLFSREIQTAKAIVENEELIYCIVDRGDYCTGFEIVSSNTQFYLKLNYNGLVSTDDDDFLMSKEEINN